MYSNLRRHIMNAIASILAHTVGHASLHIPLSDRHLSYILFYSKLLNIVPWKQCIWRHSVLYWCIVRHTTFYLNKHCKHLAAALSWKRPKYSTFSIYISDVCKKKGTTSKKRYHFSKWVWDQKSLETQSPFIWWFPKGWRVPVIH